MTTARDKEALRRSLERALEDYLAGRKTQRAIIGDIQSSNMRGKELAALLEGQRAKGDAALYDAMRRECEARGWLR
ncbi:MAG: hypothetical protein HY680_10760 [Chloroflexi bacterium]|nr:hypothetical protein [Chloroflexota bacterium]